MPINKLHGRGRMSAQPEGPLTDEQIEAFRRDGYVVVPGTLGPDEIKGFANLRSFFNRQRTPPRDGT